MFTSHDETQHEKPEPSVEREYLLKQARTRLLAAGALEECDAQLLRRVSLSISDHDRMFVHDATHYLQVGLSAIRCVRKALRPTPPKSGVCRILDFPSGHGRVLRFLKAAFPSAIITCAEIDFEALRFCKTHFGSLSMLSRRGFANLRCPDRFDIIWCGSLCTHLDESDCRALLSFFIRHTAKGGVCLFSTHGRQSVEWINDGTVTYDLPDADLRRITGQFAAHGYGYAEYPGNSSYGVSLASRSRMQELASQVGRWREVMFMEHEWDNHQDIHVYTL